MGTWSDVNLTLQLGVCRRSRHVGGELKTVGSDTRPRRRGSPARRRGPGRAPPSGRKRAGPGGHAGTCQGKRGKAILEARPARARAHVQARTRCAGRPVTSVLTEHGPRRRVRRRAAGRTSGVDVHAGADGGRVPDGRRRRPHRDGQRGVAGRPAWTSTPGRGGLSPRGPAPT